MLFEFESRL